MKRLVVVIVLVGCLGFVGCRTQERVVEVVRTDTLIQVKVDRDSVYVERHDSIVTNIQGDTVMIEKWHWRDRWRERERYDTLYVSKHDTVRVKEVVTKQNGEKIGWWKRVRMAVGDLVLLAVVLLAVVLGIKWAIMKFVRP